MAVETIDNKPTKPKWTGIPMSEKQREEHLKAFSDIDLCITSLGSCKTRKKALKCKK